VGAKRTAIGGFQGSLKDTGAVELGTLVTRGLLAESQIDAECINEVVFGNVLSAGLGQNIARQIAVGAEIGFEVPSYTVNQVCASGMKAVQLGWQAIAIGEADVIVAGGVENMNQAPYLVKGARSGLRMNDSVLEDSMVRDGLWCAIKNYHMGVTAENLAKRYGISREEQDAFAMWSQQKAAQAIASGQFVDEIVPIPIKTRTETIEFKTDEHPRAGTTVDALAKLRPAFNQNGTVTAGNASGITDGAAAVVLASEEFVRSRKIRAIAEVTGFASVGVAPEIMGMGPAAAVSKLVQKTHMTLDEIDVVELNEAFAVQSLAVLREVHFPREKVNVNGGAIALGHPIGASGARILVTLLGVMEKRELKTGLASLCVGGGMGIAMLVRLCN